MDAQIPSHVNVRIEICRRAERIGSEDRLEQTCGSQSSREGSLGLKTLKMTRGSEDGGETGFQRR